MAKKLVPHSIESESGVVGSCLLDWAKACRKVSDGLTAGMFYTKEHQLIWEAISFLLSENKPVDILTVRNYLDDRGMLEQAWWNAKLIALTEGFFTSSNIEQYAKVVRNKYLRRAIIKTGADLQLLWWQDDDNIEDVFSCVGATVNKLTALHTIKNLQTIDDDVETYQEWLEERTGKRIFWFSWGSNLEWLDENTDWIQRKKTYRIGANSNVGKTQLIYNIICSLLKQGARVAFFTLENERVTTLNYILASLQGENSRDIIRGEVKPDLNLLYPYKDLLTIVDNVNDIGEIEKIVTKNTFDVVILDYIGLVKVKGATTEGKFAEYAEKIPKIAKDNNLSWIDLSNLPKNADDDTIKLYGEFFGSSALRNNLDVGIHLTYYKPFYEWKEDVIKQRMLSPDQMSSLHTKQVLNVMITKNRLWPTGIDKPYVVSFNKGGRFNEATQEEISKWGF